MRKAIFYHNSVSSVVIDYPHENKSIYDWCALRGGFDYYGGKPR